MDSVAQDVLDFWFKELEPSQHWVKDAHLDAEIETRFGELLNKAANNGCAHWRTSAEGRLAEIIVLDQFSRNVFRDEAGAFANDVLARQLCREAIEQGADKALPVDQRSFMYMPLMHSEELEDHQLALKVYDQPSLENNLDFELRHFRIIERFGRYPHRNEILGRESTSDEMTFLTQPGSSF